MHIACETIYRPPYLPQLAYLNQGTHQPQWPLPPSPEKTSHTTPTRQTYQHHPNHSFHPDLHLRKTPPHPLPPASDKTSKQPSISIKPPGNASRQPPKLCRQHKPSKPQTEKNQKNPNKIYKYNNFLLLHERDSTQHVPTRTTSRRRRANDHLKHRTSRDKQQPRLHRTIPNISIDSPLPTHQQTVNPVQLAIHISS